MMSVSSGSVSSDTQNVKHVADMDTDERQSADEMDERRREQIAYEYLCHLEEARLWMESCIHEELPATTELEESLTNGVILAKLANFFAPSVAPLRKIFDKDLTRYKERGLHFRHTDNIMYLIRAMDHIGLPQVFYPETTDIYDMKNMPRAIYCIHALSLYLYKLGIAPLIQDLYGTATFTEEEISAMKLALDKYGINMPAFGKIGGILASELSDNDAALHAAIVAINESIDRGEPQGTVEALKNPDSRLNDINDELAENYQQLLSDSKQKKCEQTELKGKDQAELDWYDKMLTQAEIQGHVSKINLETAVSNINTAVESNNEPLLSSTMCSREASLSGVVPDHISSYMEHLTALKATEEFKDKKLGHSDIQNCVATANESANKLKSMLGVVSKINSLLEDPSKASELMVLLQKPEAMFPPVDSTRPFLYMDNLQREKMEKEEDLTHEELVVHLQLLEAVASINKCIDNKDENRLLDALENSNAKLEEVDESLGSRYLSHFVAVKKEKCEEVGMDHDDLNHMEIQALVEYVNTEVQEENDLLVVLGQMNEVISGGDAERIITLLQQASAKLTGVRPKNAELYAILLTELKAQKAKECGDENAELWHEEIQQCIDRGNLIAEEAEKMSAALLSINESINKSDSADLFLALKSKTAALLSITPECSEQYHRKLKLAKADKDGPGWQGWTEHRVQGYTYYDNVLSPGDCRWSTPPTFQSDLGNLSRDEVQAVISSVTAEHDHELFLHANEPSVIKIQSQWRGHQARKEYEVMKDLIFNQIPAAIKVQAAWRRFIAKKKFTERKELLHSNENSVIKIQSIVRMWQTRKRYLERKQYFNDNINKIIKIQAFLRANMALNDYKMLSKPCPPAKNVRKFLHLLQNDHIDFQEELELQKLKAQVVTDIRSLAQLENDLNTMDIKIGLLVRNRITLQDVVMHNTKLKREKGEKNNAIASTGQQYNTGLKGLSREKREQLEGYQNLFYLLQTNPNYLARLIFKMPQTKTTKFIEGVVLTLYNYASNQREEYLLLKLFETALKEEITDKIDQIVEIVTGNPTVIKMVVHFNRGAKGQTSLRDILSPLVKEVLTDKNLQINTSPTEVYKQWINQMESESGKASELPYDVDSDFAMKQPEVAKRVAASISSLSAASDKFLNSFIRSKDKIPYGMRYVAKTLKESLEMKFPDAKQDEILKVVGNLIYYRYMNPAIVAPDAFDIVDISMDKGLSQDQRRNLGSIAKVLQYAASNKMFDRENAHLSALNPYISEAFAKFKQFFIDASKVEDPETYFNIDQYSDITMVTKPVVYMTVQEIIDTHQLLVEHVAEITDLEDDPLRELLDDLGEVPLVEDVVGTTKPSDVNGTEEANEQASSNLLGRTEISLTLTNKFEVPDDDDSDMKALFVRTKKLIVEVMRVQPADNLSTMLDTPATKQQELEHSKIVRTRMEDEKKNKEQKSASVQRSNSMHGESKLPLKDVKKKILRNLKILEQQGLVSQSNHYQEIINAIAKDIRNQRKYRQSRKQELNKLRVTLENLNRKSLFYEEQVGYYNQYIQVCLDNLNKKKRTGSSKKSRKQSQSQDAVTKGTIKYSAQKLYEKGVVLEIQGLPPAQFKNVQFEISTVEDLVGVFEVSAKFMGVAMEKVELVFQDLLQLQYDGVAVMKMFGKAKINVNLLIFLLNKKFYGK